MGPRLRPPERRRGLRGRRARLPRRALRRRRALIALIGDTHLPRGTRRLPDECVRLLAEASLILHVGNFTSARVLEEIRALGPVAAVRGNMDDAELRHVLPDRLEVEAGEVRIGLVHDGGPARGRPERLAGAFPSCAVVVYGHSHWPELARVGETWIVNPGSPTDRRRAPAHTMAVLLADRPELVRLD